MIYFISDIHVQFGRKTLPSIKNHIKKVIGKQLIEVVEKTGKLETVIISGDLAEDNKAIIASLEVFQEYFNNVIYVLGNHEYYLTDNTYYSSSDKIHDLKQVIEEMGIILLNRDIVEINGLVIGGANMWYPLNNSNLEKWNEISNDSEYITGLNINKEYELSKEWYLSNVDKVDIMVTHVPVIRTNAHREFDNTDFYLAKMDKFAEINIYGHTHEVDIFKHKGSIFLTNGVGFTGNKIDENGLLKGLSID